MVTSEEGMGQAGLRAALSLVRHGQGILVRPDSEHPTIGLGYHLNSSHFRPCYRLSHRNH